MINKEKIAELIYGAEGTMLEFKRSFEWEDKKERSDYLKSMAALYNTKGGFIVFGIEDDGSQVGVNDEFSKLDVSKITQIVNGHFQPFVVFEKYTVEFEDKKYGIIEVKSREGIPAICKKDGASIFDSDIYYRYSGSSSKIKSGELIEIFNDLRGSKLYDLQSKSRKVDIKPKVQIGQYRKYNLEFDAKVHVSENPAWLRKIIIDEPKNIRFDFPQSDKDLNFAMPSFHMGQTWNGFTEKNVENTHFKFKVIIADKDGNLYYNEYEKEQFQNMRSLHPEFIEYTGTL